MENMRDLLRNQLGRSLEALPELARLEAAWPVACGAAMARRGTLIAFTGGRLEIEVTDELWLGEMQARRGVLERELARIAGVPLGGIDFRVKRSGGGRV